MAIEIKQLVIRAVVEQRPERRGAEPGPHAAASSKVEPVSGLRPGDRQEIVAACTRQVMRELRRRRER